MMRLTSRAVAVVVILLVLTGGFGYASGWYSAMVAAPVPVTTFGLTNGDLTLNSLDLNEYKLQGTDITNATITKEASYTVWKSGSTYYALNGATGATTSNANAATLVQGLLNSGVVSLFFKNGDYVFTATLTPSAMDQLSGESWDTKFYLASTLHAALIDIDIVDTVKISNIAFDGINESTSTQGLIFLENCNYISIDRCSFRNMHTVGILSSQQTNYAVISNCRSEDTPHQAYNIQGHGNILRDSIARNCSERAIVVGSAIGCQVVNNYVNQAGSVGEGIQISYEATDTLIDGNRVYNCLTGRSMVIEAKDGGGLGTHLIYHTDITNNFITNSSGGIILASDGGNQIVYLNINNNEMDIYPNSAVYIDHNIGGMHYVSITNNMLNAVMDISLFPSDFRVYRNRGIVTENSGTATVLSGTTSIYILHGCSYTPTAKDISYVFTELPTNVITYQYIGNLSATGFTLYTSDPGGSNLDLSWAVRRTP
jgi:hypothetical protein